MKLWRKLYVQAKHGDKKHKEWLKRNLKEFFESHVDPLEKEIISLKKELFEIKNQ